MGHLERSRRNQKTPNRSTITNSVRTKFKLTPRIEIPLPSDQATHVAETRAVITNQSHPLTNQIRIRQNDPVTICASRVEASSIQKRRRRPAKAAIPELETGNRKPETIFRPPQPPATSQQSPSHQSAPIRFPRWPRCPCMRPH